MIEGVIHVAAFNTGETYYWVNTDVANMTIQARSDSCANEAMGDSFLMNVAFHLEQI